MLRYVSTLKLTHYLLKKLLSFFSYKPVHLLDHWDSYFINLISIIDAKIAV